MNYLDLFSGIGGFTLGLQSARIPFDWHGYSEIDPYAESVYQCYFKEAERMGDVTKINTKELPKLDLITFGWPCQDISIAGHRGGLQASRSGLFFEATRIIRATRPRYFIAENVKGLFSSNNGADFLIVLQEITDIGYDCQWQLLNTRWLLPQNRERIYIVGHLRDRPRPKVFPLTESDLWTPATQTKARGARQRIRTEDSKDIAGSLLKRYKGDGSDTIVQVGDACDGYGASGRIQDPEGSCSTLLKAMGTGGNNVPLIWEGQIGPKDHSGSRVYSTDGIATTIKAFGGGHGAKTGLYTVDSNTKKGFEEAEEGDSVNYSNASSKTRRGRVGKGEANTIDRNMQQGVVDNTSIRRLTPLECERLQGFPDGWTEGLSDTRRYQALGNAVSVPIVWAVAKKLKEEIDAK